MQRRRDTLADLRSGAIDFQGVLALAAFDEYIARLRIMPTLMAIPGWGKKRAERAIDAAGLDDRRTIGWLVGPRGGRSLAALKAIIDPPPAPSDAPGWPWWSDPTQSPCYRADSAVT